MTNREQDGNKDEKTLLPGTEGARRATGVSGNGAASADHADPEVPAKAKRRRFTTEYRLKILREADRCKDPGEIGALLRREGLYSSLLSTWRQQREQGALQAMRLVRRGPKPKAVDPRVKELEKKNARLEKQLKQAHAIIEVQKKVAEILGIPLKSQPDDENE
jgi:transposase-like protein